MPQGYINLEKGERLAQEKSYITKL